MYQSTDICGVNPIAAMPFTSQGELDYASFSRMLEHLAAAGIQGLTLFGIASEFPKLDDNERLLLSNQFLSDLRGSGVFRAISVTDHSP